MSWPARIGAALLIALAGAFTVWLAGAILIWLNTMIPGEYMLALAGAIFAVAVIGDFVYDSMRRRE